MESGVKHAANPPRQQKAQQPPTDETHGAGAGSTATVASPGGTADPAEEDTATELELEEPAFIPFTFHGDRTEYVVGGGHVGHLQQVDGLKSE